MENGAPDTLPLDLAIIGGGPAGAAAALEARRRGLQVAIWERGRFPRDKVCGEFVSAESIPWLQQAIPTAVARSAVIRRAEFIARSGRRYSFVLPSPAHGLSRFVLDEALWQAAIHSGAEAFNDTAIHRIHRCSADAGSSRARSAQSGAGRGVARTMTNALPKRQFWGVQPATGARRSTRVVLVACGRWWSLEGFPSPVQGRHATRSWLGAKAHFTGVPPRDAVEMYFFPGGYCGLAPIEDGLFNVCCLVDSSLAPRLGARTLADFALWLTKVARHPALDARLRPATQVSETLATAPVQPVRRHPDHDGALLAGDAAGFLDPFTGDGIAQAIEAGRLAAEVAAWMCTEGVSLALAADAYRRRLGHAVRRSYKVAGLLRLLAGVPAGLQDLAASLLSGFAARLVRETRWHGDPGIEVASDTLTPER
jgi:menaquinone-9 beta-reductase